MAKIRIDYNLILNLSPELSVLQCWFAKSSFELKLKNMTGIFFITMRFGSVRFHGFLKEDNF